MRHETRLIIDWVVSNISKFVEIAHKLSAVLPIISKTTVKFKVPVFRTKMGQCSFLFLLVFGFVLLCFASFSVLINFVLILFVRNLGTLNFPLVAEMGKY